MSKRETGTELIVGTRAGRGISPSEVAQLRRGELEPSGVGDLAGRAAGLYAPAAPAAGELVPNESGWLVGSGNLRERLYPRLSRWVSLTIPLAPVVRYASLPWGFATLVAVLGAVVAMPRLRLRRQLRLAEPVLRLAEVPDETLVRVRGMIAAQASVPTLFRGRPAVLFRNRIAPADETRGLDFSLDLDGGEQVRVSVRRAFLLDSPTLTREPPGCGPVSAHTIDSRHVLRSDLFVGTRMRSWFGRYESSVGPGDRVEVCGVVRHVPAPDLQSGFLRVPPMRHVLEAAEDLPLLVRRA